MIDLSNKVLKTHFGQGGAKNIKGQRWGQRWKLEKNLPGRSDLESGQVVDFFFDPKLCPLIFFAASWSTREHSTSFERSTSYLLKPDTQGADTSVRVL